MISIIEAFFSGCISKIINDGKDYSWPKIKSVIKDRHDQNISTKICRVIEKVLNIVTDKKFKDTDKLYNAIEKIFIEFRDNGDTLESVKCGLDVLGADASDQRCEIFLEKFYEEICLDNDLCKVVMMELEQKDIKINQEGFQKLNEKIDRNHREIVEKLDNINGSKLINEDNITSRKLKFQNNKKQDYIKNWNSRLFLHLDNDERPITLADAFIIPDYKMYQRNKRIGFSDFDSLDNIMRKYVRYFRTSTMLITGVPGMGKSSIASWIANEYKDDENIIILRFRDFTKKDLNNGLLNSICRMLACERGDLESKVIILDGFDEIKILSMRDKLLNSFFNEIKDFENFKCIVTSRPTYVTNLHGFENFVHLKEFNLKRVEMFYKIIIGKSLDIRDNVCLNLEVLGIPVILYMSLMSNINFNENPTKPELYNKIFATKGGIFDKFYKDGIDYSNGAQIFRNTENISKYLTFLQNVAFTMFNKNSLFIYPEDCEIPILEFQGDFVSILEFPIKHLFEDTQNNIEFVHKSIYEYFVSEYLFNSICQMIDAYKTESKFAKALGEVMVKRIEFSDEIYDFLQYKINNNLKDTFYFVNKVFQLMLDNGMTYYTGVCYKNVIECEMNIFVGMLDFLHLWKDKIIQANLRIKDYLIHSKGINLNISKMNLSGLDLSGVDLSEKNMQETNMQGANLDRANLSNSNLKGICMERTSLIYTIFDEKQIEYLRGKCILINTRVFIANKNIVIKYDDYCKSNKKY